MKHDNKHIVKHKDKNFFILLFDNTILWNKSNNILIYYIDETYSQLAFTCSKLTIETLEQGLKSVQS